MLQLLPRTRPCLAWRLSLAQHNVQVGQHCCSADNVLVQKSILQTLQWWRMPMPPRYPHAHCLCASAFNVFSESPRLPLEVQCVLDVAPLPHKRQRRVGCNGCSCILRNVSNSILWYNTNCIVRGDRNNCIMRRGSNCILRSSNNCIRRSDRNCILRRGCHCIRWRISLRQMASAAFGSRGRSLGRLVDSRRSPCAARRELISTMRSSP